MARVKQMPTGASGVQAQADWTVETFGTPALYKSVFTAGPACKFPAIAGGADLAVGKAIFQLPAGAIITRGTDINIALQQTEDNVTADTPDLGVGTTIASGAVAVLGGTAGFENLLTGQTMDDCDGTFEAATVNTSLVIAAADSHIGYLNVADGWAADGEAALGIQGTVTVWWSPA